MVRYLFYLPERGHDFVAPRADVRALMVGSKEPTMSVQDGQKYMPALREDGTIGLVTRGDTGFLSQKYISEMEEREDMQLNNSTKSVLDSESDVLAEKDEYYHPSLFDSSVSVDAVTEILHEEFLKVDIENQLPDLRSREHVVVGNIDHVVVGDEVKPLDTRTSKEKLKSNRSRHALNPIKHVSEGRIRRPLAKRPSRYANVVTVAYDAYKSVICALLFLLVHVWC